ncbi:MAG: restriction endonuclease subunit S [Eubacterium sp.]|nr:restriction endonuclease subunit S [Eubacterium sp.]
MKVNDLFTVQYGVNLELMTLEILPKNDKEGINFVARTAENNGVVARVRKIDGIEIQPAGVLSCASGGSVLSTFVQREPFYSGRDLYILTPKKSMSLQEKLYWCMCIKANAYKYAYGRQANKTLKYIELPDKVPEWVYTVPISPYTTANVNNPLALRDASNWREFELGQLFDFIKGRRLTKEDMSEGSTNYLGAISENNGVRQQIDAPAIYKANCITVNYNGSVGEAFYQSFPFWATDDINVLYAKGWMLNKYIALFITTVIKANRYKFSYGRKWTMEKMKKSQIKLPATSQGLPDWDYMEQYIKALPYADRI